MSVTVTAAKVTNSVKIAIAHEHGVSELSLDKNLIGLLIESLRQTHTQVFLNNDTTVASRCIMDSKTLIDLC